MIPTSYKLHFEYTYNMTKYEVSILGLKAAINIVIHKLQVYGDSQIVINQINDVYNTKDEKL